MTRRRLMTAVLTSTAVIGVLVVLVGAALWHADGGRWYGVSTPSMGRAAPVGSLLLTRPVDAVDVAVGDLVTFRSPDSGVVYSHRVVRHDGSGLVTRGDVNGAPDPWVLGDADLVGEVVWHAPVLGWLLRALPLLGIGLVVVWLATRLVAPVRRTSWRVVGASWSVAVVSLLLHPWVGMERLAQLPARRGASGVRMELVSTGLLPIRAEGGGGVVSGTLHNGDVARLALTEPGKDGGYAVLSSLALGPWGWAVVVLVCLVPMLWVLCVGLPPVPERQAGTSEPEPEHPDQGAAPAFADWALT